MFNHHITPNIGLNLSRQYRLVLHRQHVNMDDKFSQPMSKL